MVEIMLPKASRVKKGKVWPAEKAANCRVVDSLRAGYGPEKLDKSPGFQEFSWSS